MFGEKAIFYKKQFFSKNYIFYLNEKKFYYKNLGKIYKKTLTTLFKIEF